MLLMIITLRLNHQFFIYRLNYYYLILQKYIFFCIYFFIYIVLYIHIYIINQLVIK